MTGTWSKRTQAVHGGARRSQYGEMSEAMFLTQGFDYPSAEAAEARFIEAGEDEFIYARYGNPTVAIFEDRMATIEGAEACFATASGMAAVNGALMATVRAGDRVVAARALFGSCLWILEELMPRMGVEVAFVDGTDLDQWRAAVTPGTRAVFFETVSNPTLEVIDTAAVAAIAHAAGAAVIVDNVFATPVFSDAVAKGADLVVYSTTKHVDGQGRCLGGAILGPRATVRGPVETYMKHTGGAISPFNAWVMLKGLETLDLRVRAQAESARTIAGALVADGRLDHVIYPGLATHPQHALFPAGGTVLSVLVPEGQAGAFRLLDGLEIWKISNNLGDAKSIATHPATTTHQRLSEERRATLGITPGLVRLSVGLEDPDDLISDLRSALDSV
ncbi:O-succinylhomoserine sulfhydrylase [Rhodovulum sp. ES.010]|uniref:O-succinylhomoserine sulfhydrylase n=1 Tax=Rhodovulum sp. ES.010 TaxID=1882821 RepID=UPI0009276684|nr:O-succinylhomoserine sulfhydrylase [Rhodovulum sp. ES.010]SIO33135.1 O-succinylhomoserine sulfhydrylase [Rhodovulum sp. ES.010]